MIVGSQLDIFDIFESDYKNQNLNGILAMIGEHMPDVKVAAVFVPTFYVPGSGGADPSFALKKNGKYKIYSFWHGELNQRHFRIVDKLPNHDWIEL